MTTINETTIGQDCDSYEAAEITTPQVGVEETFFELLRADERASGGELIDRHEGELDARHAVPPSFPAPASLKPVPGQRRQPAPWATRGDGCGEVSDAAAERAELRDCTAGGRFEEGDLHPGVSGLYGDSVPEVVLAAAVVGQTLLDLVAFGDRLAGAIRTEARDIGRWSKAYGDARRWFLSDRDDYLFLFANCCGHLGLNRTAARAAVLRRFPPSDSFWPSNRPPNESRGESDVQGDGGPAASS